MPILADLGPDPEQWPSEAATAADQSDDRGALLAFGGRDGGRPIGGVWGGGAPPGRKKNLNSLQILENCPVRTGNCNFVPKR